MKKAYDQLYQQVKQQTDDRLADFLNGKTVAAVKIDDHYASLLQQIAILVGRGGKRMRPLLVVLGYQGFEGKLKQAIIDVASAQELFHAFILMHDDIIDRDKIRWRGPNIIGHYQDIFLESLSAPDAMHLANSWGLLAGDVCYGLSQELLLHAAFPTEQRLAAQQIVQETLFAMIGGELLDVALEVYTDRTVSDEQLLRVCEYKTAVYSFSTPLQLGALFAGADDQALSKIAGFGKNIGIAFQLQDDLLGMFADEAQTGKPSLSDLREGKQTLLIAKAMQMGSPAQQHTITKLLGDPKAGSSELAKMRKLLIATGAQSAVQAMSNKYLKKARLVLTNKIFTPEVEQLLDQLITDLLITT